MRTINLVYGANRVKAHVIYYIDLKSIGVVDMAKQKRCAVCRESYSPWNSLQKVCSPGCALKLKSHLDSLEFNKETRRRKKNLSDSDPNLWMKKAQAMFNAFIRERDKHLGCISCDKPVTWPGQWAAGHYMSTGARPDLRFNENNVHKQCNCDCNKAKSGNIVNYRTRLIKKIGLEEVEKLERDNNEPARYRLEDYKVIYRKYQSMLKLLKQSKGSA